MACLTLCSPPSRAPFYGPHSGASCRVIAPFPGALTAPDFWALVTHPWVL